MSTASLTLGAPPVIHRTVRRLRAMVRAYVTLDGLAAIAITVGVSFWIGLLLDWMFEPTPAVRVAMWLLVIAATGTVAWKALLSKSFARLPDSSLALLVERAYPELQEGLVTAIESRGRQFNLEHDLLMRYTNSATAAQLESLRLGRVFRYSPLLWKLCVAIGLAASILWLAAFQSAVFGFWLDRMQLSLDAWPRRAQLTVADFSPHEGSKVVRIARDDDYELKVLASIIDGHTAPERIEIRYRLTDGRRGRDTMTKIGEAVAGQDEAQQYRYLFKNLSSDLEFDILGDDDRINGLKLQIVERPQIVRTLADCEFPAYMERAPQSLPFSSRAEIPVGSHVMFRVETNKPLREVEIHDSARTHEYPITISSEDPKQFSFPIESVAEDQLLLVTMRDADNVSNREPYRLFVSVIPDNEPDVNVRLQGIGSAVTPQANIPLSGQITDDYGLQETWIEYRVDDEEPLRRELPLPRSNARELKDLGRFDLAEVDSSTGQRSLTLEPGQQITLVAKAKDAYDLGDAPQVGSSQRFVLDVVTESELRSMLERRELGLRQRFEAIHEKMIATRELLDRIESAEDLETSSDASAEEQQRSRERARLRFSGALQSITQLSYETMGVAEGFDEIVVELSNNRLDTEELKNRLIEGIAEPLKGIAGNLIPELEQRVVEYQGVFGEPESNQHRTETLIQTDVVLEAMQQVLDRMLELESYNELVELLRGIIRDQERVSEETQKLRREKLRSLLDED